MQERRDLAKNREENREEEHREDESREEEHRETGVTSHPFDPVKLKNKVTQSQVLKTTAPSKKKSHFLKPLLQPR